MPLSRRKPEGAEGVTASTNGRRGRHANIISRKDDILGGGDGVRDLNQNQKHTRSWVSLRHRLHETLVESGTRGIERLQSLPKMSELVTTIRGDVSRKTYETSTVAAWSRGSSTAGCCVTPRSIVCIVSQTNALYAALRTASKCVDTPRCVDVSLWLIPFFRPGKGK